jgi:hypothetical protein
MIFDDGYDRLNLPVQRLTADASDADAAKLRLQLDSLINEKCSRFDVHNVKTALYPELLPVPASGPRKEFAKKRNAELLDRKFDPEELASKAMMGPAWFGWWLEYRDSLKQRIGCLIRAVDGNGETVLRIDEWQKDWDYRYVVTMAADSPVVDGRIEYVPDAFEILVDPTTEMFASAQIDSTLTGETLRAAEEASNVVRRCIEIMNWDEIALTTPIQGSTPVVGGNSKRSDNGSKKSKSVATVIRFEPWLVKMKRQYYYRKGAGHQMCWHLRKGGYRNYTILSPLGGRVSVNGKAKKLTLGKNYGRLKFKPAEVNRGLGTFHAKVGVIKVGDVANEETANEQA